MKELLILRHGKSDWNAESRDDHERPLKPRGTKAAADIGRFLRKAGRVPELVVSSTAVRARTTSELAADAGDWGCEIELDRSLYGASVRAVLAAAARYGADHDRILIAGHEPTSSSTLAHLTGARVRFPTGAVACLLLPVDTWSELVDRSAGTLAGRVELAWFIIPRLLSDMI